MASKKTSRTPKSATTEPIEAAPVKTSRPRRATVASTKASKATAPVEGAAAPPPPATRPAAKAPARRKTVAASSPERAPVPPEPSAASAPRRPVSDDDIRLRAYFLSLEHRGQGSDIDFWLLAERELRPRAGKRD